MEPARLCGQTKGVCDEASKAANAPTERPHCEREFGEARSGLIATLKHTLFPIQIELTLAAEKIPQEISHKLAAPPLEYARRRKWLAFAMMAQQPRDLLSA